MLKLVERDAYLAPYNLSIEGRHRYFLQREKEFTKNGRQTLSSFASGYLYFGLHRTSTGQANKGLTGFSFQRAIVSRNIFALSFIIHMRFYNFAQLLENI